VNVRPRLLASRHIEIASAWRTAADEHRIVILRQQGLQAVDAFAATKLDTQIEDVADLFVDHAFGQAELGDLAADHAAGALVGIENHALVAQGREVTGNGQRCRSCAHEGNALAVLFRGGPRESIADIFLEVGGNTLQPANRHRFGLSFFVATFFNTAATTGGLARPVTGATEDSGKDVRLPVDHVRVAITAGRDHADVLGYGSMGRASPLAIDDFVEIVRVGDIRRFQNAALQVVLTAGIFRAIRAIGRKSA
jgi:hypothetical protein